MGATWARVRPRGRRPTPSARCASASDGSLIVSVGDGASFSDTDAGGLDPGLFGTGKTSTQEDIGAFRAQYTGSLAGKILRINPAERPGLPEQSLLGRQRELGAVARVGLRLPQPVPLQHPTRHGRHQSLEPAIPARSTSAMSAGARGRSATSSLPAAATTGWPCYEGQGGSAYTSANPSHHGCNTIGTSTNPGPLKFPVMMWNHTSQFANGSIPSGLVGNASIGGVFYTGTSYPTAYRNNYFFGDFGESWIKVAVLNARATS